MIVLSGPFDHKCQEGTVLYVAVTVFSVCITIANHKNDEETSSL